MQCPERLYRMWLAMALCKFCFYLGMPVSSACWPATAFAYLPSRSISVRGKSDMTVKVKESKPKELKGRRFGYLRARHCD